MAETSDNETARGEEAAGTSEQTLLRLLWEKTEEAVVQLDSDGRYLSLNAAALHVMQRSRAELIGRIAWEAFPELAGTLFHQNALRAQRDNQEITYETFYAPLNRWFRVRVVPDAASGVVTCLIRDVTPERTHQAQRLLDAGLVGILYWSITGGVVDANDTFLQMLGYSRADLLEGRIDWIEMTPPDLREKDAQPIADLYDTGRHLPFEKEYVRKDGSRIPILVASAFNENSKTDGIGFVVDISAQKKAQTEARERGEEIITIFESMTDAFFALDKDWRFTYLNAEAEHMLRRTREELIGAVVWEEFPGAIDATFGREYHRAVREQVPVVFEEFYPPLDLWFDVRAYPSKSGGLSVYFQNVSERKRAERDRDAEREVLLTRQRQFMRDVVFSLTEGKFRLCLTEADLPPHLAPTCDTVTLTLPNLRVLRHRLRGVMEALHFAQERAQDTETAVGEAAMNAATHGGGGDGWVCSDAERGTVQIWLKDNGTGISEEALPRVLEKGVSTAGTLGHGFWMMLQTCDRVHLLTSPSGTTVVLEMDRTPPDPAWLKSAMG